VGQPLFRGTSTGMQLDAIAQFLGTPSVTDLKAMLPCGSISGPQLAELAKPKHSPRPWADCLPAFRDNASALAIVAAILVYDPAARLPPGEALVHAFFSGLVNEPTLPADIFNFTAEELSSCSGCTTTTLLSWKMSNTTSGSSTAEEPSSCSGCTTTTQIPGKMPNTTNGNSTDSPTPLRRTRTVTGECPTPGHFNLPGKRNKRDCYISKYADCYRVPAQSPKSKRSFTFKPSAVVQPVCLAVQVESAVSHVNKNDVFTEVLEVQEDPLLRVQSVSSDVSMGVAEMDVDI